MPFHLYLYYPYFWFGLSLIFLWEVVERITEYVFDGDYPFFVGDAVSNAPESAFDSMIYDVFNGLVGILMAHLLLKLVGRGADGWTPVTFWASNAAEWGLWPPARLLGCACAGASVAERTRRRVYWKRAVQVKLLTVPGAVFYAWVLDAGFRIGTTLYLALNVVLLLIFAWWNRDVSRHRTRYAWLYAWWIAVTVVLGASQSIPIRPIPPAFASWAVAAFVLVAESSALLTLRARPDSKTFAFESIPIEIAFDIF